MASPLWLIDRSRIADGRGFCARARLLNYHVGPHGYGIQLTGQRIPLATGAYYHQGLGAILDWCREFYDRPESFLQQYQQTGQAVPWVIVRNGIQTALDAYARTVEQRGFAGMADQEGIRATLREQQYLIEGLIWAWVLEVLPDVLTRGRIVEVEHDDVYTFGCTCGLGDGIPPYQAHEQRDCQGIGLMCKPDFLLETWTTGELEYHEFKGTSSDGPAFRDKWEVMIQMFAATLDAEARTGKQVQSIYVHGLLKGKRGGAYNKATGKYDLGPDVQSSIFCYGYRKPANPPMEREEWAAEYEWTDETGGHRLSKAYQKTGVWELPDSLLQSDETKIASKAEFWAKWIPASVRRKQLVLLGPFSRQSLMVEGFLEECKGEEARVQAGLWAAYERGQQILAEAYPDGTEMLNTDMAEVWWEVVWPDPRFQSVLNQHFPRSYECRRFGSRMSCQFEDICFRREGWANPLGTRRYQIRRPHHAAELSQMVERGIVPPDFGSEEEIE